MDKTEKAIQEAKNEKQRMQRDKAELETKLRIRQAEISLTDSFIDILKDLSK